MKTKAILVSALMTLAACTGKHEPVSINLDEVDSLIQVTVRSLDLDKTLALADSLERSGVITTAKANFVRGRAYDEGWQMYLAEYYYKKCYDACVDPAKDWNLYAESGYRLSALRNMKFDLEGSLNVAMEMIAKADQEPQFPIVYKAFLLNNIANCQQILGQNEESQKNYLLAYETLKAEEGKVSDLRYRSDMFHMTLDITEHLYEIGDYKGALEWVQRSEEQQNHYSQLPGSVYAEKDKAYMSIIKTMILFQLGQKAEAARLYKDINLGKLNDPPSIKWRGRYLMATGQYGEAADCYAQWDSTYLVTDGAKSSFDVFRERILPRFQACLKAGRIHEVVNISSHFIEALDSAIVHGKKTRVLELSTIYETQKKEAALENASFMKKVYLYINIAVVLAMLIFVGLFLWTRKMYREMLKKNHALYKDAQQKQAQQDKDFERLEKSPREKLSPSQQLFVKLCKVMEEQMLFTNSDLNRTELASVLGTNYKYVSDAVRECTDGQNLSWFINSYRVKYAAKLLLEGEESISMIMDRSGFVNRSNFNKVFRSQYKLTPSEFRAAALGKGYEKEEEKDPDGGGGKK